MGDKYIPAVTSVLTLLLGVLVPCLIAYIHSYSKEKGKNRALREDVTKLETEKQAIAANHARALEELKQQHSLDIEKRKYRYESKKEQYFLFMERFDNYNARSLEIVADTMAPIMMEYHRSPSKARSEELTHEFNNKAQQADMELMKQEAELFSQLNAFRLISSEEVIDLIERLLHEIQRTREAQQKILSFIGTPEFQVTRRIPQEMFSTTPVTKIPEIKSALARAMRSELDEI